MVSVCGNNSLLKKTSAKNLSHLYIYKVYIEGVNFKKKVF